MNAKPRPTPLRIQSFKNKIKAEHHDLEKEKPNANHTIFQSFTSLIGHSKDKQSYTNSKVPNHAIHQEHSNQMTTPISSMTQSIVLQSQFRNLFYKNSKEENVQESSFAFKIFKVQHKDEKLMKQTAKFAVIKDKYSSHTKLDRVKQQLFQSNNENMSEKYISREQAMNYGNSKYKPNQQKQIDSRIDHKNYDKSGLNYMKQSLSSLHKHDNKDNNPEHSEYFNGLPIDSNVKSNRSYRSIPIAQTQTIQPASTHKNNKMNTNFISKTFNQNEDTYSPEPTRKRKFNQASQTRSKTITPQPFTQTKINEPNDSSGLNFLAKLLASSFQMNNTEKQKKYIKVTTPSKGEEQDAEKTTNNILKLVANLGHNKSDKQIDRLKNRMKSQKNLKLKDYLRLASLSNDVKYDRYNKSLNKNKTTKFESKRNLLALTQENSDIMKRSSLFDKSKNPIDSEKSIALIQASLNKKLQSTISSSLKLLELIQEGKGLVGLEYQDLVFMCNFHRIYDQNLFKTVDLLEDIFKQYEDKRQINNMMNKKDPITHEQVIEMLSPRKKKKSEDFNLGLIQKILFGFNIIKNGQQSSNTQIQEPKRE